MSKKYILCTGGLGYIGSHTIVQLIQNEYEPVILDNLCNASIKVLDRVEEIAGRKLIMVKVDLCDKDALEGVFAKYPIDSVIHYAAHKSVGDSMGKPLEYYRNNLIGLINLLEVMNSHSCKKLVFSSSCCVYQLGSAPLDEQCPLGAPNPYGETKVMGEKIMKDLAQADKTWRIISLRYFNPIGAHSSGLIGECPSEPTNIVPIIQEVAIGARKQVEVWGNNYPTPDGTGIRDYLHVVDLADGHLSALKKISTVDEGFYDVYNLGSGVGLSVLELINTFEKASGVKINFVYGPRRPGDLHKVVADCSKAEKELGWKPHKTPFDACKDAWNFIQKNPKGFE